MRSLLLLESNRNASAASDDSDADHREGNEVACSDQARHSAKSRSVSGRLKAEEARSSRSKVDMSCVSQSKSKQSMSQNNDQPAMIQVSPDSHLTAQITNNKTESDARFDLLEKRVKQIEELETVFESFKKQLSTLQKLTLANGDHSNSPQRTDMSKNVQLTNEEKRDIIRSRRRILDLREVKTKTVNLAQSSPQQEIRMDELVMQAKASAPFTWDSNQRKWLQPD